MRGRGFASVVIAGFVAGVLGCEGADSGGAVTLGPGAVVDEAPVKILPKWKLPGDYRVPGKADAYDTYRAQHPEWYALTVPPAKQGFRTATEWQDMMGVLLGFPGSQGTSVNNSMAQMVVQGVDYVDWYVVVPSTSAQTTFVNILKSNGLSQATIDAKVHFLKFSLDSIWMIDYGPFTLVAPDGSVAFADFRYYHQRIYDDAIPTKVGSALGITTYRAGMDYEGGNFQMDEVGTCYLSQGAFWENPDKTEAQVKEILTQYLGCKTFIVLAPLEDGTTHIDMFSKLVAKNVFVLGRATPSTATTTTIKTLDQDNAILNAAVLADGSKLTVHRIPMPYQKDGVWRTYTNATLANGLNLWPIYSINKDLEAQALSVWQAALPGWDHVGINSDTIITWGGAMHCISRALPAGTYTKWVPDGTCSGGTCQAPEGGYDGSCTSSAQCVGPKWLCALPDCGPAPQTCGNITWEGCCDGEVLKYCEDNQLVTMNCSSDPHCGWNASQGFYDCGTSGGADPSGQNPKSCPGACTPNCTGKVCGDDGCGGSCGTCPAGQTCHAGQCVPNVEYPNQCLGPDQPSASSCTAVETYEGCCDAYGRVIWCEDGQLYCVDCANRYPQCGWDPEGFYNCGTNGGADPSGQFPKACGGTCTPNCTGKVCGDDGCGGSCGTCPAGQACQAGQCVGCTPDCAGKECGDDGCGGSCGTCPAGQTCQDGQCVGCTPDCAGKECGDDGCGGSCGTCPTGQECQKGQCVCLPQCSGKECGDDGCGGSCGTCSGGLFCQAGKCVGCTPDCAGKECGNDGCGGSCGTCADGETCQVGQCVPAAADTAPDTATPDTSQPDASCTPDCAGRQCGPDGCGGSCGTCPSGFECSAQGQCLSLPPPDSLPDAGTPADVGGGGHPSADSGTANKSGGSGCATAKGEPSWPASLVLMGLLGLALRRRPRLG